MSIEVLLVDEDTDVLNIVQTFLQQEDGLEITSEADPRTALELALTDEFDVVVSDYTMPQLDGLELCAKLREEGRSIPFLLFSAREPEEIRGDAEAAGVSGIVQKGTGTEQYTDLANRIYAAT